MGKRPDSRDSRSDGRSAPDPGPDSRFFRETPWDAIVYDLDGTLVRLVVDWDAVRTAVKTVFEAAEHPVGDDDLWTLLERSRDVGLLDPVEETIAAYERAGAVRSLSLPMGAALPEEHRPTGVCSLNSEDACRIALDRHGYADDVEAVVGRDSTGAWKPDPEPLERAIEELGAVPETTVFIGDSSRDAETARRTGCEFLHVDRALEMLSEER